MENEKSPSPGYNKPGWTKVERKRKKQPVQIREALLPKRHFWCAFTPNGEERWFIEFTNGRVISDADDSYQFWLKKYNNKIIGT